MWALLLELLPVALLLLLLWKVWPKSDPDDHD